MTKDKFSKEHHIKIYDDTEGAALTVRPDTEATTYVQLCTEGAKSIEWYGDIRLVMPPKLARLVGEALIQQADLLEKAPT